MPAVLVELGFLTNPSEEDFLQSARGKELLASAIYRAIKSYKYKRETRDAVAQSTSIVTEIDLEQEEVVETTPVTATPSDDKRPVEVPENPIQIDLSIPVSLYYSVQIAVSRNDLECLPQNFNGLTEVHKKENYGLFKYYYGKVSSYKEAEQLKTTAKEHFPDAYIVAFDASGKIDLEEAKKRAP